LHVRIVGLTGKVEEDEVTFLPKGGIVDELLEFVSRTTASSNRSPNSTCLPGTTYCPGHLWLCNNNNSPFALKMNAPTVGSGKI